MDLPRRGKQGKCIKTEISKFIGQWICLAEGSKENASKLKFQNSLVNGYASPREEREIHQNRNFKIHWLMDLPRRGKQGKCIKTEISKFIGQWICLAEGSKGNASKLKFQNSLVNGYASPREQGKMHQN